jgi:hypothetical protein
LKTIVVAALVALAGCDSATFTKPDMVGSDPGADLAECRHEPDVALCMKRKGYSLH